MNSPIHKYETLVREGRARERERMNVWGVEYLIDHDNIENNTHSHRAHKEARPHRTDRDRWADMGTHEREEVRALVHVHNRQSDWRQHPVQTRVQRRAYRRRQQREI